MIPSIFKDNKYTRWYYCIISKPDMTVAYTERHHVIPRSMGGVDDESNLVSVSARQHYVLHRLLVKMVKHQYLGKAWAGWRAMALMVHNGRKPIITSKLFAKFREEHSKHVSSCLQKNWADPQRRAEIIAQIKQTRTVSWREAALKASTPEVNAKKSESAKKRRWSDEVRQKMSDSRKALYADPIKRELAIMRSHATKVANGTTEAEVARRI